MLAPVSVPGALLSVKLMSLSAWPALRITLAPNRFVSVISMTPLPVVKSALATSATGSGRGERDCGGFGPGKPESEDQRERTDFARDYHGTKRSVTESVTPAARGQQRRGQVEPTGESAMMMMLGLPGGNAPTAFSDAMVLLRIAADPADATARLEAMQTAYEQLTARTTELEAREKAVTDGEAALAEAEKKFDVESEALDRDQADHEARTAELEKRERTVDRETALEAESQKLAADRAVVDNLRSASAEQLRQWLSAVGGHDRALHGGHSALARHLWLFADGRRQPR
jgi:hypothetical protein